MSTDPIDDYLAELIGEATVSHAQPTPSLAAHDTALSEEESIAQPLSVEMHAPVDEVPSDAGLQAVDVSSPAVETDQTAEQLPVRDAADMETDLLTAASTDAWTSILLEELDADPLFERAPPAPAPTSDVSVVDTIHTDDSSTEQMPWTASLLDELDSDPLFANDPPAIDPTITKATGLSATETDAWTNVLLAELDDDPQFAGQSSSEHSASETDSEQPIAARNEDWTKLLLEELDNDPNFSTAQNPAQTPPPTEDAPSTVGEKPTLKVANSPAQPLWSAQSNTVLDDASDEHPRQRRAADRASRWLRLRCGEQPYALELLKVQEVGLNAPLLHLRGTPQHMLGIMNLRGQVVPVMDLGVFLGGTVSDDETASTRIVVLESEGQTLGLRVSAVDDVTNLTESQIEPPDTARLCRFSNHLFRGIARLGGPPMILLDADALLS